MGSRGIVWIYHGVGAACVFVICVVAFKERKSMKTCFSIPIVLITFKRPNLVEQQLERLRQIRPEKLFWISDAARRENNEETKLVEQTRKLTEKIDWPCELIRIFASENMGCDKRIVE